ncbi:DNA repair protein RecN [Corynebacterium sp. TAE3-ERU12]|uniref:DNA repair protein RecN n=1 Tax=Corynebacterium sp. TAE3-ERU12 TaxID=2849491 RepID=UPI001C47216C|nr:DNA repair protein RecN [Corynebacterium sp. TAE3-ERU12]MBV7295527.1 DNA repair protein RecN [Corynebacterium sp. TAE3-ERU12]
MLTDLAIRNLGVITGSTVEFAPGLTVLTGETGAGKTMVVTGLRLLAGGRADAGRVRSGAEKALVEGHISTDGMGDLARAAITGALTECGGETDENGEILLARQVSAKGRSRAWVGGRTTPAGTLGTISAAAIAIHGQNDQLRLLGNDEQRGALDRYGDNGHNQLLERYRKAYTTWRGLDKDLKERTASRRELAMRADQLRFAIDEIDAVNPEPGEDERLVETVRRLQDVDTLRDAATAALMAIDGAAEDTTSEESAAAELLGGAQHHLATAGDDELRDLAERIGAVTTELSEISADLGRFAEALPDDDGDLDTLLTRQADIRQLTRKYAPTIDGVLTWRTKAAAQLDSLDVSEEALDELAKKVAAAHKDLQAVAKKLTSSRSALAKKLGAAVTEELAGLAMPNSVLQVSVDDAGGFGPEGADTVTFGLAGHADDTPRPLATSASGGELSRVMLALEVVLASSDSGQTLVFDEVDAGVGGRAAVEIGRRLARLAQRNQVIVVTHLPQVAAYADTHLHIAKDSGASSVESGVNELSRNQRVEELARMMAGLDDTESGRAHATDLLERAEYDRAQLSTSRR